MDHDTIQAVLILIVIVSAYLFPTVNAVRRQHNNIAAIAVLNILLGWTFVGWVGALVWSFTNDRTIVDVETQIGSRNANIIRWSVAIILIILGALAYHFVRWG